MPRLPRKAFLKKSSCGRRGPENCARKKRMVCERLSGVTARSSRRAAHTGFAESLIRLLTNWRPFQTFRCTQTLEPFPYARIAQEAQKLCFGKTLQEALPSREGERFELGCLLGLQGPARALCWEGF